MARMNSQCFHGQIWLNGHLKSPCQLYCTTSTQLQSGSAEPVRAHITMAAALVHNTAHAGLGKTVFPLLPLPGLLILAGAASSLTRRSSQFVNTSPAKWASNVLAEACMARQAG